MKYRHALKWLCLIFAAMLLAACGAASGAGEGTDPAETTAPPPPAIADFSSGWALVQSDRSNACADSMKLLQTAFEELFGYAPVMCSDFFTKNEMPPEYEIVVGKTERDTAASVYETLGEDEYTYTVVSDKVVVIAGNNAGNTLRAAKAFLLDCFGYSGEGTGKAAVIPVGTSFTGEYRVPFKNPVLDNFADPDVLYHDGVYYMYATSYSIGVGYEVYTSTDLENWENKGICMGNAWGFDRWYWAPDVEYHDGKFYMLVSADEHLGFAVADDPLGPFEPCENYLFAGTIDGHIFFDGDEMYIYYVTWRSGHSYGIWGCKMMDDHLTPDLSTEKKLLSPKMDYEKVMNPVTEGPYMLKRDGVYYLTYSGSDYQSQGYCVCYATSDSPLGSFTRYEENPILMGDGKTSFGAGHHCFAPLPDSENKDEFAIVYHIHKDKYTIHPRRICVDLARFRATENGVILECDGPNMTEK